MNSISKESFSKDSMNKFALEFLRNKYRQEEFNKLKRIVLAASFKDTLAALIKQEFITNFDRETIDKLLSEVDIITLCKALVGQQDGEKTEIITEKADIPEKLRSYDYTKYYYNGQVYGKNRLVLAVLTDYVHQHPGIRHKELREAFPDSLQGTESSLLKTKRL